MDSFAGLLNNSALMLILCVIYDTFNLSSVSNKVVKQICTGILVGAISIFVMLNPWYIQPGVFFDTRWVLLSLSGLFFGFAPTTIAVLLAGSFRLYQGGPGGVVGTVVIIVTAAVGVCWRYYHAKGNRSLTWLELYLFGIVVQLAMLACMFLMPAQMRMPILKAVGPPILVIYPVLTMLIGLIMKRQEDRRIAERELAANRLALQRERGLLRDVINSIPDSIFFKDTQGRYLGCNNAFTAISGKDERVLIGKVDSEVFNPHCSDFMSSDDNQVLEDQEPIVAQQWFAFDDSGERLLSTVKTPFKDLDGVLQGLVGIIRDVTERYKAELALRASEAKFSKAFHVAPLLMSISSLDEGVYYDVNDTFVRVTGYLREKVIGTKSIELGLIGGEARGKIKKGILEDGFIREMELTLTKADGSDLYCIYSGEIIEVAGEKRLLSIAMDMTERKKLERNLLQAQKMEAIGKLAGGIAHDFNNILASMMGYTEIALEESPPGSFQAGVLHNVMSGGERAKELVQQILAFSRQGTSEAVLMRPVDAIEEALKMLRSTLPATIDIVQDITPSTGTILMDPSHFNQIVMNLCTNAYHAMEKTGGILRVSLCNSIMDSQPFVHVAVEDSGPGISTEVQKRVFEPYFTTKEMGKGTGLGLAIVHGLVNRYNGNISLESSVGAGTRVHVYLPVTHGRVAAGEQDDDSVPGGSERILFVDDEQIVLDMSRIMLKRLGYQVVVYNDSIAALRRFAEEPGGFDLVITDQTMPKMTGFELAGKMIEIRPDIPIILCTGYCEFVSEGEAKKAGIREFAHKPLGRKQMATLIRSALRRP